MTRWRLVQTPAFGIYLHRFTGPDPDQDLHDHPWSFVSLILQGGYVEQIPGRRLSREMRVFRGLRRVNTHKAEDRHKIVKLIRNPTWSLVLVGRRRREWGFWENGSFVPWREYVENHHYPS